MRDYSVNIAKGLTIILMVLGHADCPDFINSYLVMMTMPLFFFMSGYCFKEKYLSDAKTWLKRRVTGIYWPYLKWSLFFLLIHNICFYLNIYNAEYGFEGRTSDLYSMSDFISRAIAIATRMQRHEALLGGFWFLKSLFFGSIIFFLTIKLLKGSKFGVLLLLVVSLALSYTKLRLPYFNIGSRECLAAFYIYFGHLYKMKQLLWHKNIWLNILFVVIVGFGSVYWKASMTKVNYIQMLPYAISSIMGVLVIFNISQHIAQLGQSKTKQFLIYVGGYTFNVLTWHFLSMKVVSLLIIFLYGLPTERLAEFPVIKEYADSGWWVAYFIVGVAIPVAGTFVYHTIKDKIALKQTVKK